MTKPPAQQRQSAPRRGLLIVRAGDRSLHPAWLSGQGSARRNWDLHLSYFGDRTESQVAAAPDITITREKGPKFLGLMECLTKIEDRLAAYDYIGFPDDDLYADCATWNNFFDILLRYRPLLAQPALDRRSFYSYPSLLRNPACLLRWTNFVEVMTPVFSREALSVARGYFSENKSGWGMDFLWPTLFEAEKKRLCVVDATPVLHTRAVRSGPLYKSLNASGAPDPMDELAQFRNRHGLRATPMRVFGGVSRAGKAFVSDETSFPLGLPEKVRARFRLKFGITEIKGCKVAL